MLKADELAALNYIRRDHPRPVSLTWINRGTDKEMRPTTVQMLLRTLFKPTRSRSVRQLHESSGLRASFESAKDRELFAKAYGTAVAEHRRRQRHELTAVFDRPDAAEDAFRRLVAAGVDKAAISLLWHAGQFIEERRVKPRGHSALSVAAASAGGGLAAAIFGVTLLAIPGLGIVAAGGAVATSALGTMGAIGGALGATGGALARMLTDLDVDDREIPYFEAAIKSGKVFLSVDPATIDMGVADVRRIIVKSGGHFSDEERA